KKGLPGALVRASCLVGPRSPWKTSRTPDHHRFQRTVVVPCSMRKPRGKQGATITEWLASLGLSEYAQRFAESDIDVAVLRHLTDQDLKEIGVSLGHRRKILASIAELPAPTSAPP